MSKTIIAIIMRLFVYFSVLLFGAAMFIGCTPEKRLGRLLKKHPQLLKSDTVFQTDYDTIPEIRINTVFKTDTSTAGLDSIFASFQGQISAALSAQMKGEVRNYIVNRPFLPDTITQAHDGITVKIYQDGDQIGLIVHRNEEVVSEIQPIEVHSVSVDNVQTFQQKLLPYALIVIILIVIHLYFKKHT